MKTPVPKIKEIAEPALEDDHTSEDKTVRDFIFFARQLLKNAGTVIWKEAAWSHDNVQEKIRRGHES